MKTRPRGVTLIETVVFVTTVTLMLALTTTLLFQMLQLDRGERKRVVNVATIDRLGRDFRADLHRATGPIERTDARLVLPIGDGQAIEYQIRDDDILRTVQKGGKAKGFEAYRRPAGTLAKFAASNEPGVSMIRLVFNLAPKLPGDPVFQGFAIEAAVGRNATPATVQKGAP